MKKIVNNLIFVLAIIIIFFSGFYLYLNIKWSRELKNTFEELKQENQLPQKADIIPPTVPDNKNAALEFENIFIELTSGENGKKFTWQGGDSFTSKIESILSLNLEDNNLFSTENKIKLELLNSTEISKIIDYLKLAEQKPFLNFYLDFEAGPDMLLPHLKIIRALYKIICIKALYEAKHENKSKAYNLLLTGLKTNNLLLQEPIIITQLIRIANDIRMTTTLEKIIKINGISSSQAKDFIIELNKHNKIKPFLKIADTEIIFMGMYIYDGLLYGKDDLKWESIKNLLENPLPLDYLPTFLIEPFLKKDYSEYLRQMTEFKTFIKTPYWELSEERLSRLLNSTEAPPDYCIICKMIMPSLIKLLQKITNYRTDISKTILSLAIEIYNNKHKYSPKTINDITPGILQRFPIDYTTGKNLKLNDINQ